jgi:hypothetical protein
VSSNFPPNGPQGGPEYLEQGGGAPIQPPASERRTGGGKKSALIGGGVIAGLVLVGGGIWAATWYFNSGPQPAEALPDTTLGYVSVDLDPSGAQKIEALKTLNKFPAIKDQLNLDAEDDIRKRIFDESGLADHCDGLDYGDDVEPWLGDRAAVAAVDLGKDQPTPVVVLQVSDADAADEGMSALFDCATSNGDKPAGWVVEGDWMVIAETEDLAQEVSDDAADSPLTDDSDYQSWTDEVGDVGIVNMYAAPGAGDYLAENLNGLENMFGGSSDYATSCSFDTDPADCEDSYDSSSTDMLVPSELTDALKDFKGMAATVRFDDGALELEVAGDPGLSRGQLYATDHGDDAVSTLPEDTAAAIGVGFEQGWFTDLVDQMASYSNGEMSAEELMSQMSQESGLDLPADAETLAGESMSLSIGSGFDPETFFNSGDGSGVPVAAKVNGDSDAIEGVLDKVRDQMNAEEDTKALESDSSGDMVAIGPDSDYRSQVLENGNLGDTEVFKDVVREADKASFLMFVNFDAGDDWLANLAGGDPEAKENLAPLQGFGISAWQEDDAAHAVMRLTTD